MDTYLNKASSCTVKNMIRLVSVTNILKFQLYWHLALEFSYLHRKLNKRRTLNFPYVLGRKRGSRRASKSKHQKGCSQMGVPFNPLHFPLGVTEICKGPVRSHYRPAFSSIKSLKNEHFFFLNNT